MREWFSSLEKLDSGIVIMRNDVACQMVGISTIRIKMFDGVVKDLTDVRYVPHMKKNIISAQGDVRKWNSQGHKGVLGCDEGDQRQKLVLLEG